MRLPLHHITLLGCALTFALLVVVAVASLFAHQHAIDGARLVTHTREVTADFQRLLTLVVDQETATRGYALSGDPAFLAPRQEALVAVPLILDHLRTLTADNPAQQARLARLAPLIARRTAVAQQTIDIRAASGLEAAAGQVSTRAGMDLMTAIRGELDAGLDLERELVEQRAAAGERTARATLAVLAADFTLQALLLVVGGGIVIREQRRRQRAGDELARVATVQRVLLDTAPVAIISCTTDGTIASFNSGAERMLGYRAEELVGRQSPAVFHDATEVAARAAQWSTAERPVAPGFAVFRHQAERLTGQTLEWTCVRKDGTLLSALLALSPLGSPAVALDGYLGVVTDISERKRAELALGAKTIELERSNTELQQFAYVASHDLQEPLRMVASYTGLLARRYGDRLDQDAREFIAFATDGAQRMQTLINDLLAYARIGHHPRPLAAVAADLCLDRALVHLGQAIRDSGATIERGPLPVVMGDDGQLVQLFQNLVGNALKYHAPGTAPVVRIAARADGARHAISIADNGIGIAPEYHERIFGLFQRLHSRHEFGGTGIGLAICRKIAERHGGGIAVASAVGGGSTFTVTLSAPPAAGDRPSGGHHPPERP